MVLDFGKYPFMVSVDEVLERENAMDLYTLLSTDGKAIREAKARIKDIIAGAEVKRFKAYTSPYLVFFAEMLILGVLDDPRITEKVIRREIQLFARDMSKEGDEELSTIARWLGLNLRLSPLKLHDKKKTITLNYSLHFLEYLRAIEGHKGNLSLTQRILSKGFVYLDKSTLLQLLSLALYRRLRDMVKPISLDQIPETLKEVIVVKGRKTPPCIRSIQDRKDRTQEEALTLAVYMANTGSSVDSISLILEKAGIENPLEITKRIYKEKIVTYSCKRMKEMGLCVAECNTKSPLQFYYGNADMTK